MTLYLWEHEVALTQPCPSAALPGISAGSIAEDDNDCGPDRPLLAEFLDQHALEMEELRNAFGEQQKRDETRRTNLCSRIEQKVSMVYARLHHAKESFISLHPI